MRSPFLQKGIIRAMSRISQNIADASDRIKPLEGVGVVLLFLAALIVFLAAVMTLVRLVMG